MGGKDLRQGLCGILGRRRDLRARGDVCENKWRDCTMCQRLGLPEQRALHVWLLRPCTASPAPSLDVCDSALFCLPAATGVRYPFCLVPTTVKYTASVTSSHGRRPHADTVCCLHWGLRACVATPGAALGRVAAHPACCTTRGTAPRCGHLPSQPRSLRGCHCWACGSSSRLAPPPPPCDAPLLRCPAYQP